MPRHHGAELRARLHATGAHAAVISTVLDTDSFEAVLADDARHFGRPTDRPAPHIEAARLAPALLVAALQDPTPAEIVTAAEIAGLHHHAA